MGGLLNFLSQLDMQQSLRGVITATSDLRLLSWLRSIIAPSLVAE